MHAPCKPQGCVSGARQGGHPLQCTRWHSSCCRGAGPAFILPRGRRCPQQRCAPRAAKHPAALGPTRRQHAAGPPSASPCGQPACARAPADTCGIMLGWCNVCSRQREGRAWHGRAALPYQHGHPSSCHPYKREISTRASPPLPGPPPSLLSGRQAPSASLRAQQLHPSC